MPFTPFHLGPGLAVKSLGGRRFSFLLFGFSQVLIDLEPSYYILTDQPPLHRFFHTYLGATLILVLSLLFGKPICEIVIRVWNGTIDGNSRFALQPSISWLAALLGAGVGAYSHVLLDSIMHSDMRPFAPFAAGNNLLGAITVEQLHLACVYLGLAGVFILLAIFLLRRDQRSRS